MNAPIRVPYISIHVGRSDDIEVARCGLNGHKPDRVYGSCRLPGFTLQHAECFLGQWLHVHREASRASWNPAHCQTVHLSAAW